MNFYPKKHNALEHSLKGKLRQTEVANKKMRNNMSTTFLQQILSVRLLLVVIIGTKK